MVIRGIVSHLYRAAADRIEGFERRYQFTRRIDLDLQPPARRPFDTIGEVVDGDTETRVLRWPGGGYRPLEGFTELRRRSDRAVFLLCAGRNARGGRKAATARSLGLTREGLYKKMRRLGIE